MTDVLDRLIEPTPMPDRDEQPVPTPGRPFAPSIAGRALLGTLSAAAGVVHLVMLPSHMGESTIEGVGFALAGWFQLAVAAVVLTRPTQALLRASILANLALIAAWVVSRTAGLPFGDHAGHAESASFVDITCVGLEAALILASCALLARPSIGRGMSTPALGLASVVPVGILALATAALASPSARNHAVDSHGGHGDVAASANGHSHGAPATKDDKGLSLLVNGHSEHRAPVKLDAQTQEQLDVQLAVTREIAAQYPTVAEAEAAGFSRVGPYFPGIGAHYMRGFAQGMNPDGLIDDNDLRNPLMVIYDGTQPTSKVAGFMFYSSASTEPEGFTGGNDVWHIHENLCLKYSGGVIDVPYGLDHQATPEQCASAGGSILPISQWMTHVWSVPDYEIPAADGGVFAEVNPALKCADGTYYMMPLDLWVSHRLNICRSEL